MRTLRRYLKPVVLAFVQGLFYLADVLMRCYADDEPADTICNTTTPAADTVTPAEMAAALESVASEIHIRNSVSLCGWPDATADLLVAAGVTAEKVDRLLCDALQRLQ
jgi:hypothetical protein